MAGQCSRSQGSAGGKGRWRWATAPQVWSYLGNQNASHLRLTPNCSTRACGLGLRLSGGESLKARCPRGQEGAGTGPLAHLSWRGEWGGGLLAWLQSLVGCRALVHNRESSPAARVRHQAGQENPGELHGRPGILSGHLPFVPNQGLPLSSRHLEPLPGFCVWRTETGFETLQEPVMLCDLGQVTCTLCAFLSSSEKWR